jgi:hypothetical protein
LICDYGCGQESKFKLKNGKLCCHKNYQSCPYFIKKCNVKKIGVKFSEERKENISKAKKGKIPWNKNMIMEDRIGDKNPFYGKIHTEETKRKISEKHRGKTISKEHKRKIRLTIEKINEKYPFFSKIEEMRYNPTNIDEIQFHCKNHNCSNSKENNGWFTPTKIQFQERIRQLGKNGEDKGYLYCSQKCKYTCPLYNKRSKGKCSSSNKEKNYTNEEYQIFRQYVLERDNYLCQYCGEKAEHVHHEKPQKLEPFFILDPDYAWSCCEKCHYEKGHKEECSTKNIANKNCEKK